MAWSRWLGSSGLVLLLAGLLYADVPEAPHGLAVAAVPSLSYSSGEGWEYGGKLFFYQFGEGQIQPYRWHLLINGARSTERKQDYYGFLDMPHLWGEGTRLDLRVEYKDFGLDEFYGLGNLPAYRDEITRSDHPDYLAEEFYNYKHRWTAAYINAQWPAFAGQIKLLAGLAGVRTTLSTYPLPNQLGSTPQRGMAGGWTNYARVGLVMDTRDQEAVPTSGHWSDLLIEKCTALLGSDYDYGRITLTDRRYYSVLPRLVYAQRLFVEYMPGRPPFYEMSVLSGSYQRFEGLGSNRSMRGVPRLLFVAPTKLLANFELRYRAFTMRILRQDLTFYGHLFLDGGRVWLKGDPATLDDFHLSEGAGLHVQWKKDLIGAIDIGRSEYNDMAIYLTFGNLF
jgi:outer membrane protein assembly factor BamA